MLVTGERGLPRTALSHSVCQFASCCNPAWVKRAKCVTVVCSSPCVWRQHLIYIRNKQQVRCVIMFQWFSLHSMFTVTKPNGRILCPRLTDCGKSICTVSDVGVNISQLLIKPKFNLGWSCRLTLETVSRFYPRACFR